MLEQRLRDLISPTVEAMGCELWGVEHLSGQGLLRVYIDKTSAPVVLDDCERISRQLSALLDVEDPLPGKYTLEVSSPGLERRLFEAAHWERYVGSKIKVRLRPGTQEPKNFSGRICSVEGDKVTLELDTEEMIEVVLGDIFRAQLVYEMEDAQG